MWSPSYHYEIHNTETNKDYCSDHINSYLIMSDLRDCLKDGEITDSMIDEWVTGESMLSSRLLGGIPMVMTH